jgi:cytochrome c553
VRQNAVPTKAEVPRGPAPRAGRAERLSLVIVLATACACVWLFVGGRAVAIAPAAPAPAAQEQDFSKFQHGSAKHASLACASCHQRARDNSISPAYDGRASLPGHKACTDCHLAQFVQQNNAMCAICHTSVENSAHPPVKDFPGLLSFNARFDHAQHNTGAARPAAGRASQRARY